MAQRSLPKRLWYDFLRVFFRVLGVALYRVRVFNRQHVPAAGGVLVLSNHQSHLDPILVGLSCDRRLNYVARDSLFGFAPFRWLINSLDAIPLHREGIGLGGLKESLKRLKAGEMLLIFPEGTRTRDGEVGPLKPGFLALARRSQATLLPVAIEGAFESMPRHSLFPVPTVIHVQFGPPLVPADFATWDDEALLRAINDGIRQCHDIVRQRRNRIEYSPVCKSADRC